MAISMNRVASLNQHPTRECCFIYKDLKRRERERERERRIAAHSTVSGVYHVGLVASENDIRACTSIIAHIPLFLLLFQARQEDAMQESETK